MAAKTLRDVLTPVDNNDLLRWRVVIPLGTNPFLVLELFQFAFVGAVIVLLILTMGVWFTEGGITMEDIRASLEIAALVLAGLMGGFFLISFIFFGNRYYGTYSLDSSGIYHEGSRGNDGRHEWLSLRVRPYSVSGEITANRTRSRHLIWEKIDRFQNIPGMRVVILRRGIWHMMRIYTPDAATHEELVAYLNTRLRQQ